MTNISFIIPAYNEQKLIGRCIDSIRFAVNLYNNNYRFYAKTNGSNASFINYEIVVVNNNSTDFTAHVASARGAKVVFCEKKGVTRARQEGYYLAKYNLHAYVDADTFVSSLWLSKILLFDDNDVMCLSGPYKFEGQNYSERMFTKIFYKVARLLHHVWPTIQGGNFIIRKEVLDKIGGHSVNIDFYGEDTDLAKRVSKYGKIVLVKEMEALTSARRLNNQGRISTVLHYVINYFSIHWFNKPFSKRYKDYRPDK